MRDLSPEVRKFAQERGLTPAEVRNMVKAAAVVTHARGNRRYHDYVFQIEGRNIVSMADLNAGAGVTKKQDAPLRPDEFVQYEECEQCHGDGCEACNNEGEVRYVRRLSGQKSNPMR